VGARPNFFDHLGMPKPDIDVGAGSGSHAEQTARVMMAFEKVCLEAHPDRVIVVGDVNSTLACTLTAKKLGIEVAHVEAGLRSRDRGMPEEINRLLHRRAVRRPLHHRPDRLGEPPKRGRGGGADPFCRQFDDRHLGQAPAAGIPVVAAP